MGLLGVERAGELSGDGKHPSSIDEAREIDNKDRLGAKLRAERFAVILPQVRPLGVVATFGLPSEWVLGLFRDMLDEIQSEPGDDADDEPVAAKSASESIRAITSGRARWGVGPKFVPLLLSPTDE